MVQPNIDVSSLIGHVTPQVDNVTVDTSIIYDLPRVKGYNGAMIYPTKPNSRIPLFDEDDDVFYVVKTDSANNKYSIEKKRFVDEPITEIVGTPQANIPENIATIDDIKGIKEDMEDVKQSIRELAAAFNTRYAGGPGKSNNKQNTNQPRNNETGVNVENAKVQS